MASAMASAMASDAAGRAPPGMKHKMAMSHEERLAEGSRYRAEGNAFFRAGDVTAAEESYRRGAELFDVMQCESPHDPTPAAQNAASIALAAPLFTNLALCLARRGAWSDCATACTECSTSSRKRKGALAAPSEGRSHRRPSTTPRATSRARQLARVPSDARVDRRVRIPRRGETKARRARRGDPLGCFDKLNADRDDAPARRERRHGRRRHEALHGADVAPPGETFPVSARGAALRGRPRRGVRGDRRRRGESPQPARGFTTKARRGAFDWSTQVLRRRVRGAAPRFGSFSSGWTRDGHS